MSAHTLPAWCVEWRVRVGRSLVACMGLVLLVAAASKLWDIEPFATSVRGWGVVPSSLVGAIAIGLPSLELFLAVCCLVTRSRYAAIASGLLFIGLQVGWLALYYSGSPPECGCFGPLDQWVRERAGLPYDMFKSGTMAAVAFIGALLVSPPARTAQRSPPSAGDSRSAFTLIELLVCISVLAVLLAIVVPVLSGVRDHTRGVRTLGFLRQHGVAFAGYATDFKGLLPAIGTPSDPRMPPNSVGADIILANYLFAVNYWHYPLIDGGYYSGLGPNAEVFYDATEYSRSNSPSAGGISFIQSCTVLAQSEFWNSVTRTDHRQWGVARTTDFVFPSRKSLLVNTYPFYQHASGRSLWPEAPASLPVAWLLADGASESIRFDMVRPGMMTGDGPAPVLHPADMMAGLHTIDGVRGVDK